MPVFGKKMEVKRLMATSVKQMPQKKDTGQMKHKKQQKTKKSRKFHKKLKKKHRQLKSESRNITSEIPGTTQPTQTIDLDRVEAYYSRNYIKNPIITPGYVKEEYVEKVKRFVKRSKSKRTLRKARYKKATKKQYNLSKECLGFSGIKNCAKWLKSRLKKLMG